MGRWVKGRGRGRVDGGEEVGRGGAGGGGGWGAGK